MKKLIALIVFFVCVTNNAQDLKIIHINAKWNQKNNYDYLDELHNVKVQYGYLEDQAPSIKQSIKSVPTIILMKDGRPVYIWNADISLKIKSTPTEIQNVINSQRATYRRKSTD